MSYNFDIPLQPLVAEWLSQPSYSSKLELFSKILFPVCGCGEVLWTGRVQLATLVVFSVASKARFWATLVAGVSRRESFGSSSLYSFFFVDSRVLEASVFLRDLLFLLTPPVLEGWLVGWLGVGRNMSG